MFLEIVNAKHIADYKIEIGFNNAETYIVDFENELYGTVFEPLKDKDTFKQFSIKYNTIEWENGADFAPEYIYDLVKGKQQIASEPNSPYENEK
jgi:hypothetical protein